MSDIKGAGKVWHKGPPPHVGWWPASAVRKTNFLRWWNGRAWSGSVNMLANASTAAMIAKHEAVSHLSDIEWRDRPNDWP